MSLISSRSATVQKTWVRSKQSVAQKFCSLLRSSGRNLDIRRPSVHCIQRRHSAKPCCFRFSFWPDSASSKEVACGQTIRLFGCHNLAHFFRAFNEGPSHVTKQHSKVNKSHSNQNGTLPLCSWGCCCSWRLRTNERQIAFPCNNLWPRLHFSSCCRRFVDTKLTKKPSHVEKG